MSEQKYFAVKPQLLADRSKGWRGMVRIEATGASVGEVVEAERHYVPEKLIYAEGDTWFKKYSPLPLSGTNLLDAIRVPFFTAAVDVSVIGEDFAQTVTGWHAERTQHMFDFFNFDAILLSTSGIDLQQLFTRLFNERTQRRGTTPWTEPELADLADPRHHREYFREVMTHVWRFVALRDEGASTSERKPPILVHGYDYIQPRPAGSAIYAGTRLGRGPWLYPAMLQAGLKPDQMRATMDAVIDMLNEQLAELCSRAENVRLIDQRGLLRPARHDATGPDADWSDEIHPNEQGIMKLARNRWDVPLAQALGWEPSPGDLVEAAPAINASTSRPLLRQV